MKEVLSLMRAFPSSKGSAFKGSVVLLFSLMEMASKPDFDGRLFMDFCKYSLEKALI